MHHLAAEGYDVAHRPETGREMIAAMLTAPTNSGITGREVEAWFSLEDYHQAFSALPPSVQETITARWGAPEDDPMVGDHGFAMPAVFMEISRSRFSPRAAITLTRRPAIIPLICRRPLTMSLFMHG